MRYVAPEALAGERQRLRCWNHQRMSTTSVASSIAAMISWPVVEDSPVGSDSTPATVPLLTLARCASPSSAS